ncbi:MAG: BON domain-containing protein [Chloroflexi bacterium]|nr:BON domain-containing protein [Chloroflexota bacterium]
MSLLTDQIERRLAARAGIYVAVEEDEGALVLSGIIGSEEERQAALDIVAELVGDRTVIDNMDMDSELPAELEQAATSERDEHGLPRIQHATGGVSLEPGDFTTQRLVDTAEEASGPERSLAEDVVSEGDEVFVPATDPVGDPDDVIGGFELSSTDSVEVARSADGTRGDEAIRDAVIRELREDAATTALTIEVDVIGGVVRLTGRVESIDDAESAEEVAARVPGVLEVDEALDTE